MSQPIFFDGWEDIVRVAVLVPLGYLTIIFFIRTSGKRTTSQMNNFDWVVTVALGSIFGSTVMLKDVVLAEMVAAVGLLIGLQYVLTRLVRRSDAAEVLIKPAPAVLLDNGRFENEALRTERVSQAEVMAAVRDAGYSSLEDVRWVILETDASFSVISHEAARGSNSAVRNVSGVASAAH